MGLLCGGELHGNCGCGRLAQVVEFALLPLPSYISISEQGLLFLMFAADFSDGVVGVNRALSMIASSEIGGEALGC